MTRSEQVFLVVCLEARRASLEAITLYGNSVPLRGPGSSWTPPSSPAEDCGQRVAEEVARRVKVFLSENPAVKPQGLAISLPGTIDGDSVVLSSKRLGINTPIDLSAIVGAAVSLRVSVLHDVECLLAGEHKENGSATLSGRPDGAFCYIFVDEGIGSKLMIDGKVLLGAGSAGHLGRLIVQPDGAYNETFASRGPLEVFSSRPHVSSNMVGLLMAERGKKEQLVRDKSVFRRHLQAASLTDWSGLTYKHISQGISERDPIATAVLEDAAQYLGLAVNAVMTVTHPHRIVLGGGMITELPGFADSVIGYARRFSWELAWNRTQIVASALGRGAQAIGAAVLMARRADLGAS